MSIGKYVRTIEHKQHSREAAMGNKNAVGWNPSAAVRLRMSIAATRTKNATGKHWKISDAGRLNMSSAHMGHVGYWSGKVLTDEHKTKIIRQLVKFFEKKLPTSIEIKLYSELTKLGIFFEKQKLINDKFIVDAYIPALNLIIEADCDYWHSLNRVKKKDYAENAYLKKCGFALLRFSESMIMQNTFNLKKELLTYNYLI